MTSATHPAAAPSPAGAPPPAAVRPRTAAGYREAARAVLPADVWDFLEGGADEEETLRSNTEAFRRVRLRPRMLTGTTVCDTSVTVLGQTWPVPVGVAPTAHHALFHETGEGAVVAGAASLGLPVVVSSLAGAALEELRALTAAPLWFQLYPLRDPQDTEALVRRAESAGCDALVVTVDAPRLGRRHRDLANGFRVPPHIRPANLPGSPDTSDPAGHALTAFRPGADWSLLRELRRLTVLPLVVKGVLTAEDTELAARHGADAIVVSNHGGRQLDGAPATLDVLPEVVDAAAGRFPVLLDGGVRRGRDVAAALALGADAVLVGRPVLEALAVGGREGVRDLLTLLSEEFENTLFLSGRPRAAALTPDLLAPPYRPVRQPAGPAAPAPASAPVPAPAPVSGGEKVIDAGDLHRSLADPVLHTMTFLNEITQRHPDAISFAPGRPRTDLLDTGQVLDDIRRYLDDVERRHGPGHRRRTLLQYGPSSGFIREHIARMLAVEEGLTVDPDSVVVTVGCQEALFLTLRALFASPRDVLLLPEPCYVGATGAARLLDLNVAAVPDGPPEALAARVAAVATAQRDRGMRPVACYVVPDAANPQGTTLGLGTRRQLLDTAAEHDLLLLEDTPYRPFTMSDHVPTLKALDRDRRVVRLGTFAKSAFPGARLGYAVADQRVDDGTGGHPLADDLAAVKSMVTVNSSALSQAAVGGLLLRTGHDLHTANARSRSSYHAALRRALETLERLFPAGHREACGVSWNRPDGGFFLTLTVPFAADDALLALSAEQYGVIWTPMRYFAVDPPAPGTLPVRDRTLRLSCSALEPEQVEEGLERLARLIGDRTAGRSRVPDRVRVRRGDPRDHR
ncbi:aminotransferase class I/II-fold pyridoxal phosphate-dependent enzyme [Streptomyces sp. NPDC057682]|uniref:aminotransferase class I/II-fold pyridoxal phosphate-dependent enzyme n=1 Tax=Streptomyces sp. NPDC057682 TaxID=3346210 RepID=UPI0036AAEC03